MNARITWMRGEEQCTVALYMRRGPLAQQPTVVREEPTKVSHNKRQQTDKEGVD